MSANDGGGNGAGKTIAVPAAVAAAAPVAGQIVRQDFSTRQVSQSGETAMTAMAAHAEAMIKARCSMALARPRDLMVVRTRLLKECSRPGFADEAIYRKPVGEGIEGPSIRLAEAAMRAMGNMEASTEVIYDDAKKRIVRVTATDYEANISHHKDVTVPKTMERTTPKPGQVVLKSRMNSKGKPTYLVEAETDDDILNAENALASKAMRVCILRIIPGDILAEALREAYATLEKKIKEDPDEALKAMCDAYEIDLGISAEQLREYLGHPIDRTTIAEISSMKKLYTAIKEGETTWTEVMENRNSRTDAKPDSGAQAQPQAVAAKGKANLTDIAADAKAKRESAPPAAGGAQPRAAAKPAGAAQQTLGSDPLARAQPAAAKPAPEDRGDVPSDDDWNRGP